MPRDGFGRQIDYLRVSLTDHCNLRCVYCMPLRDLHFAPAEELLRAEEIEQVVRAAARVGFRKVRLTGGEPLLRQDVVEIVGRLAAIPGIQDLSMTTNGVLLPKLAPALREAGLQRVNIHLDTLNPERLRHLMRFGSVEEIRAGIDAAVEVGFTPMKLNCVVTRGYNDEDVADLARLTLQHDWFVRFIELMPLGAGECARIALTQFVPTSETKSRIEAALGRLEPLASSNPADEARNYRVEGAPGVVGFISPVSEPYCGSCNRMRLTADGRFHLCLLNDHELDVRSVLRNGAVNGALEEFFRRAVAAKPTGHRLDEGVSSEARQMFQIGG